jgi:hypothetical protein
MNTLRKSICAVSRTILVPSYPLFAGIQHHAASPCANHSAVVDCSKRATIISRAFSTGPTPTERSRRQTHEEVEHYISNLFNLENRVALVTGASGGVGAYVCKALARCACKHSTAGMGFYRSGIIMYSSVRDSSWLQSITRWTGSSLFLSGFLISCGFPPQVWSGCGSNGCR